jgi:hypothetical protein
LSSWHSRFSKKYHLKIFITAARPRPGGYSRVGSPRTRGFWGGWEKNNISPTRSPPRPARPGALVTQLRAVTSVCLLFYVFLVVLWIAVMRRTCPKPHSTFLCIRGEFIFQQLFWAVTRPSAFAGGGGNFLNRAAPRKKFGWERLRGPVTCWMALSNAT